ncbi:hypothetical protein BpHYR1_053454 [Brachionus plicatilis]|uniref:Uncharacterized protein n=1 Tax=Brachionus plicatilis TaxID=10195 RepID=A0A3M7PEV9_BRAPC|nr:hypothetical protein BpHYR1_053454 [Brachionus plicatilis]
MQIIFEIINFADQDIFTCDQIEEVTGQIKTNFVRILFLDSSSTIPVGKGKIEEKKCTTYR